MLERRKHQREYFIEPMFVAASVLNPETAEVAALECVLNDESNSGVGLKLNAPVEPGSFIRVLNVHGEKKGLVVWETKMADNDIFRAGIKFI